MTGFVADSSGRIGALTHPTTITFRFPPLETIDTATETELAGTYRGTPSMTTREPNERVRLRPARADDGEAIVDVHVASIRELGKEAYDPDQVDAWASNKHPGRYPLEDETVHTVVAERRTSGTGETDEPEADATRLAGFGWVDLEKGEITAVYVHPEDTHRGVGRKVVGELERAARAAGLESLFLYASLNAREFYERLGYDVHSVIEQEIWGERLESVRMRKRLEENR